jgi:hypothetical protein
MIVSPMVLQARRRRQRALFRLVLQVSAVVSLILWVLSKGGAS